MSQLYNGIRRNGVFKKVRETYRYVIGWSKALYEKHCHTCHVCITPDGEANGKFCWT